MALLKGLLESCRRNHARPTTYQNVEECSLKRSEEDDVEEEYDFHYFVDVFSFLMCRQMSLFSSELSTF